MIPLCATSNHSLDQVLVKCGPMMPNGTAVGLAEAFESAKWLGVRHFLPQSVKSKTVGRNKMQRCVSLKLTHITVKLQGPLQRKVLAHFEHLRSTGLSSNPCRYLTIISIQFGLTGSDWAATSGSSTSQDMDSPCCTRHGNEVGGPGVQPLLVKQFIDKQCM